MSRFTPPKDLRPYQGFIFDCDGTVADTMPAHYRAWKLALTEGGLPVEFTWEVFVSRAGMTMERTVLELGQEHTVILNQELIATRQRALFSEYSEIIEPIPDVLEFARSVAKDFPVSIASGSSRPSVERTLSLIGAGSLFPVIITPEDVVHGKPAPDMFLLAAKRMGVPPEKCLVFEDGALGIEAAKLANMDYVVVDSPIPRF